MKVSALIVTYNQEKFIEQAIRSALMQQVNFPYEIVIGEDCSTDNTRAVVERLASENPGKIRAILRDKNLGMLEGDDYWTDPLKLQKQADFLDAHPECCLCFHNVVIFDEHSEEESLYCRP